MRDDSGNDVPEQPAPSPEHGESEYPIDRLKQRLGRSFAGRPVMVYLVLFAGAATLLLLLAIVWYSATGGGNDQSPLCTAISADDATKLILAGQVGRVDVLVDRDDPLGSLTLIVLRQTDGSCRQTAQGADVRNDLYRILGVVELYNNFGDQHVRVNYQRQDVQPELLATSTPTPSPTVPPTVTNTPLPTEIPTVPAPTETPIPESPTVVATTAPSVAAGSPSPAPTESPTISATLPSG
jgi:hypothetical protein